MNKRSKVILDLLRVKKYDKVCKTWLNWNFGHWGTAPKHIEHALLVRDTVLNQYKHGIVGYSGEYLKLSPEFISEYLDEVAPSFCTVSYDRNDYMRKIQEKCAKRGISFEYKSKFFSSDF